METPSIRTTLAAAAALTATSAFAVLPSIRDYDVPNLVGVPTGFIYAYGPASTPSSHSNLAGVGVGGSNAKQGTVDFSELPALPPLGPPLFSGFGIGDNLTFTVGSVTPSNVGSLLATVDVAVGGVDVPSPTGGFNVTFEFQAPSNIFSGTTQQNAIARYRFAYPSTLPTSFATFGGLLSSATLLDNYPPGTENAATRLASLDQAYQAVVIVEFNLGNVAVTAFGLDNNNTIRIDNLSLIPEPTTYAAIAGGLTLLVAAALRRRKA